jgi:hypothetical protein
MRARAFTESTLEARLKAHRFICAIIFFFLTSAITYAQNPLLKELAREDQASRKGEKIARTDQERIRLVLQAIAGGGLKTPEDKFNAALVLQHTPLTFCEKRLVSASPDNYLLAHHLFKHAFEAGYKDAQFLVAASIDRYLSFTVSRQKYGTNRIINQDTGKEEWVPIDRDTTDIERAKYGVPPLAELLKQYPEQASRKQ